MALSLLFVLALPQLSASPAPPLPLVPARPSTHSGVAVSRADDAWQTRLDDVRADLAEGRWEVAMEVADELAHAGAPAAAVDYVTGLAWHCVASEAIARAQTSAFTTSQLEDACRLLTSALEADSQRFSDAWLPLAEAAWLGGQMHDAARAAEHAVAVAPNDAAAHALRGRIALARYSTAGPSAPGSAELYALARGAFERALALEEGARAEAATHATQGDRLVRMADLRVQRAHLEAWKGDRAQARREFALAFGLAPGAVDFPSAFEVLGAAPFAAATQAALEGAGADAPTEGRAPLFWWHGYAAYAQSDWTAAAASFRAAVEAEPTYVNSWYYVYRATFAQGAYGDALDALAVYEREDVAGLVELLGGEGEQGVARLDWLVGWCMRPGEHEDRRLNAEAALVAELLTRLQPDESRHWNNLGLFLRDRGDERRHGDGAVQGDPELAELFERATAAYRNALALDPTSPVYLNDTAVMLHYYLRRNADEARELYQRAIAEAELRIAGDLPAGERELFATVLRDARDNLRRLSAQRVDDPGE